MIHLLADDGFRNPHSRYDAPSGRRSSRVTGLPGGNGDVKDAGYDADRSSRPRSLRQRSACAPRAENGRGTTRLCVRPTRPLA
jgi:hypothetical protein